MARGPGEAPDLPPLQDAVGEFENIPAACIPSLLVLKEPPAQSKQLKNESYGELHMRNEQRSAYKSETFG